MLTKNQTAGGIQCVGQYRGEKWTDDVLGWILSSDRSPPCLQIINMEEEKHWLNPVGTPMYLFLQSERQPVGAAMPLFVPWGSILLTSLLYDTLSKALWRSLFTTSTMFPPSTIWFKSLLLFWLNWLVSPYTLLGKVPTCFIPTLMIHDLPCTKSHWLSLINLCLSNFQIHVYHMLQNLLGTIVQLAWPIYVRK